jgi:hypothetical protein
MTTTPPPTADDANVTDAEDPGAGTSGPVRTLAVVVGALILGSLFNAQALSNGANQRPPGWERDLAVGITDPLLDVSSAVFLDRPARWIRDIRTDDDSPIDTDSGPGTIFVPTADNPVHMWVTGDSLTETLAPALIRAAGATDVVKGRERVVFSAGLTRPDFFNWPDKLARGAAEEPTEIIVFMIGANDGQPILTAAGWVEDVHTEQWQTEYRVRVAAAMDVLAAAVPTIYWIGQPISRSEDHRDRIAVMNSIFEDEAATRPSIRYIDSWAMFTNESGEYTAYLPDSGGNPELVRDDDGVHLNTSGAERLANAILEAIRADWAIP